MSNDDSIAADPVEPVPGTASPVTPDTGLVPPESSGVRANGSGSPPEGLPGLVGDSLPEKRDTRFKPGEAWAGNSKGRSKGVKNRITLERLLLEEKLREKLGLKAEDLLAQAIKMAMEGNDKIMRTLLDKVLATPKNSEDGDAKDNSVQITINDLSGSSPRPVATVARGNQTLTIPSAKLIETSGDSDQ